MAEFLTRKGVSAELERIIREASMQIILISPYLQVSEEHMDRLGDAAKRGVQISVVFRENKVSSSQLMDLQRLPRIGLRCLDHLHAKCYSNERRILLSSMNLYEHSEQHNIEMGILLDHVQDRETFTSASVEIEAIRNRAVKFRMEVSKEAVRNSKIHGFYHSQSERMDGHCIRCGTTIAHNPDKPFCKTCFNIWARFEDPEFEEKFCLTCGRPGNTSMIRPECLKCYSTR